jgi:hypothetical protein
VDACIGMCWHCEISTGTPMGGYRVSASVINAESHLVVLLFHCPLFAHSEPQLGVESVSLRHRIGRVLRSSQLGYVLILYSYKYRALSVMVVIESEARHHGWTGKEYHSVTVLPTPRLSLSLPSVLLHFYHTPSLARAQQPTPPATTPHHAS